MIAALFAGVLRLRRPLFLIPYVIIAGVFLRVYWYWSDLDILAVLEDNLLWGVVGAAVIGVFVVRNVMSQPASPRLRGARFAGDVLWSGLIYGIVDASLMSVMPVLAVKDAFSDLGWGSDLATQAVVGVIALAASLFVTVAYHLGYPEFRNRSVSLPALGMGIGTAGYLLTANPIASVASHAAMHVAAVGHGPEKTVQLPPHYQA